MENTEIKVALDRETANAKLEKMLSEIETEAKKEYKERNLKNRIFVADWNAYNRLDGETQNALLERTSLHFVFSVVKVYKGKLKQEKFEAGEADYKYCDHIRYGVENLADIVSEAWIDAKVRTQFKYSDNVIHGLRCSCQNATDKCYRKDISNATALIQTGEDGEDFCIIDTSNETAKAYEIDVASWACLLADISMLSYRERFIIDSANKGYTREETASRLHGFGIDAVQVTPQAISKALKSIQAKLTANDDESVHKATVATLKRIKAMLKR